MAQDLQIANGTYPSVPSVDFAKAGGGTARYYDCTGTKSITANGTHDVTGLASVEVDVPTGGAAKNVQADLMVGTVRTTTYTDVGASITVDKTGTYTVSWMGWRSTNSGTNGSQLYIDGSAYGSANTTFANTYGQRTELNGVSLTKGQVLTIRARARGTSYYMAAGNLIIKEE